MHHLKLILEEMSERSFFFIKSGVGLSSLLSLELEVGYKVRFGSRTRKVLGRVESGN